MKTTKVNFTTDEEVAAFLKGYMFASVSSSILVGVQDEGDTKTIVLVDYDDDETGVNHA